MMPPGESLKQDPLHFLQTLIVENSSRRSLCLFLKLSSEEARCEVPVEKISQFRDLVKSSSTGGSDDTGVSCCLAQIRRENLFSVNNRLSQNFLMWGYWKKTSYCTG